MNINYDDLDDYPVSARDRTAHSVRLEAGDSGMSIADCIDYLKAKIAAKARLRTIYKSKLERGFSLTLRELDVALSIGVFGAVLDIDELRLDTLQ